jgi:hypothetical protein
VPRVPFALAVVVVLVEPVVVEPLVEPLVEPVVVEPLVEPVVVELEPWRVATSAAA